MEYKKAFTLVEILVVVGVFMIIIMSISGIIFGVFRSEDKNKATDKIDQNGDWILDELRKNILNANNSGQMGYNFTCQSYGGSSITITNRKDLKKTKIACFPDGTSYKIASISATGVGTTVYLFQKNKDLELLNCNNFVSCSTLPSLELSNVIFNFTLKAGTEGLSSGTTRVFLLDLTLRN